MHPIQSNAWGAARRASALIGAAVAVFVGAVVPAGADAPCPLVTGPIPVRAPLGDPSHDYPQYVQDVGINSAASREARGDALALLQCLPQLVQSATKPPRPR